MDEDDDEDAFIPKIKAPSAQPSLPLPGIGGNKGMPLPLPPMGKPNMPPPPAPPKKGAVLFGAGDDDEEEEDIGFKPKAKPQPTIAPPKKAPANLFKNDYDDEDDEGETLAFKPIIKPPVAKIEPPKLPSMAAKKPNLFNDDDDEEEEVGFKMPSKAAPPKLAMPIAQPKIPAPPKPQLFNNDYGEEEDAGF